MGLRDIVIPVSLVAVGDSSFTVRGLSPRDALGLYHRHAGELSALFDQFTGRANAGENVISADVLQAASSLVDGGPLIIAEIIALASDANPATADWYTDVAIAERLPFPVQFDALQKIGQLTFSSDMPPGKFIGLVLQMAQSTQAALTSQT